MPKAKIHLDVTIPLEEIIINALIILLQCTGQGLVKEVLVQLVPQKRLCGQKPTKKSGLLVDRMFGRLASPAQSALYTYTFGHPFYVASLTERVKQMRPSAERVTKERVDQAFLLEMLSLQGKTYNYCRYLYDISLQEA